MYRFALFISGLSIVLIGAWTRTEATTSAAFDETAITILLVYDPLIVPSDRTTSARLGISESWNHTDLSTTEPTSIVFANGGIAIPITGATLAGTADAQIQRVADFVSKPNSNGGPSLRTLHGADVVVAVTGSIDSPPGTLTCGVAPQPHWLGPNANFDPHADPDPPDNLDRRGRIDGYIALVASEGLCSAAINAAHEFSHLLGENHIGSPVEETIDPKARAFADFSYTGPIGGGEPTFNMALSATTSLAEEAQICLQLGWANCGYTERYSDSEVGDATHMNSVAIDMTARSVANYVESGNPPAPVPLAQCGDGVDNDGDALVDTADPDCSSPSDIDETGPPPQPGPLGCDPSQYVPENVSASRLEVCVPGTSKTSYEVEWDHACTSSTTDYQVYGSNATQGLFLVATTPNQNIELLIEGPPQIAVITVRACVWGFYCSNYSSPGVTIVDQC